MNVEIIKTYILTILVFISVLLTFAIWNYQPSYDFINNDQTVDVNEVSLGGDERTKRDVVTPTSLVLHNYDNYFGFINPREQTLFYEDMTDWTFDDPVIEQSKDVPNYNYEIELVFVQKLPAEIIRSLFVLNEEDKLPDWSFQRLFISLNDTDDTVTARFLSEDDDEQLTFTVSTSNLYNDLLAMFQEDDRLTPYVALEESDQPIYLPAKRLEMRSQTFATEKIEPNLLVNALFENKDDVTPNFGEQYYTDGQRGMRILDDGKLMEFINPIHLRVHHTDALELLERSLQNINGHRGWTDDYRLATINEADDSIQYQMYYDDLPVFNIKDLSIIEQSWRDQVLHLYSRPLFSLDNLFSADTIELASGEDIIYYLKKTKKYKIENIKNIQIGYDLSYSDSSEKGLTFKPAWFVSYNNTWHKIRFEDVYDDVEGGA